MLNRTLRVNGHPMTIVGVAQEGFESEYRRRTVDVFVPIGMTRELGRLPTPPPRRPGVDHAN